ncbi:PREDICTED: uncharacterized protein LOC109205483 [Nicotiana attenuata]|uniref:uncharacterized protein LOC109205483 n=1 Tax=Nicotiana attenuata TaxID=49451 RepID=UPI0009055359|nr:PREDICTED: uncharacterized protein LOC109205483 [Nicotiana attenuata]
MGKDDGGGYGGGSYNHNGRQFEPPQGHWRHYKSAASPRPRGTNRAPALKQRDPVGTASQGHRISCVQVQTDRRVDLLSRCFRSSTLLGSIAKDVDPVKESSKPGRSSVFAKRGAQAAALHLNKKPASSVEADITGGSTISSHAQPKQEASTASSKNYTFRKGDRVKYVGSSSGFSLLQTPLRGPTYGYRGKVVLAFEENGSSKIGVRFDKSIPEGNDLGGLCDEDHGFLCAANLLRLDSSSTDEIDKLAINELFEVVSNESKSSPLVLFIKDIEKSMVGNPMLLSRLSSNICQIMLLP